MAYGINSVQVKKRDHNHAAICPNCVNEFLGGGRINECTVMQFLTIIKSAKSVSARLKSLVSKPAVACDDDPYEREPLCQSEISDMLALYCRFDDPSGFSKGERRDHDNLAALRDILYPPTAA